MVEYSVGTDNKVAMDVVDKTGKTIGAVTITDVAKASDVGNIGKIHQDLQNTDGSKTTVVDAVNNLDNFRRSSRYVGYRCCQCRAAEKCCRRFSESF